MSSFSEPASAPRPQAEAGGAAQTWRQVTPAALLCAALLLPSLLWILNDRGVWPWDQAWYGEVAVDLWYTLTHEPKQWVAAMLTAFRTKAPGISWYGQLFVPLGVWTGSIENALLFSTLTAQFGTLYLTYRSVSRWMEGQTPIAVFAVICTASAPLFVAMSHQFFVEALQTFTVAYFFWIAISAPAMGRIRIAVHLLSACVLALLAKATAPMYFAFPAMMGFSLLFTRREWLRADESRWRLFLYLAFGICMALACLAWYAVNLPHVIDFVQIASASEVALAYGHAGTVAAKFGYWLRAFRSNFFYSGVAAGLAALGILSVALALRRRTIRVRPSWSVLLALSSVAACGLVLLALSLQINEENRYLLPILPALVLFAAWVLSLARSNALAAAACVLAAVQFAGVSMQALRLRDPDPAIAYWLTPYWIDGKRRSEMEQIVQRTGRPEIRSRYHIVGVELPWMNANSLSFYAAKARLRTGARGYYSSLGYAAADPSAGWTRLESMNIVYFITLAESNQPPPDTFNRISLPILETVRRNPCFRAMDFPSTQGIVLFQNHCKL